MLTLAQLKLISESVEALLDSAVDTLVDKAGTGHEHDVAQLLLNLTSTFSYIGISLVLSGVKDAELKSAISHIIHCLKPKGPDDLIARQIARQFLGQDEENAAVQQVVANLATRYLLSRAETLSKIDSGKKEVSALSVDFNHLLVNSSTEDADQKKKRIMDPSQSASSLVTAVLPERVRGAPDVPQRVLTRAPHLTAATEETQQLVTPETLVVLPQATPQTAPVVPQVQEETVEHRRARLEQQVRDFMRRTPRIQTHAIPVFNAHGLFTHRVGPRERPPENYHVFFVGRRADFYVKRLLESLRDRSRLTIEVIPDNARGLHRLQQAGRFAALCISDYGLGSISELCEKYRNAGIPTHKICVLAPVIIRGMNSDFKIISAPYDECLLSHLRTLSQDAAVPAMRIR